MANIDLNDEDFLRSDEIWNEEHQCTEVEVYVFGVYVGVMSDRDDAETKFHDLVKRLWDKS